jgi:hypothetical protein
MMRHLLRCGAALLTAAVAASTVGVPTSGAQTATTTPVAVIADPGGGAWVVSSTGAVVAEGGASEHGSLAGTPLSAPIVDAAPTATGEGYWLAGADGAIYAFGDATFVGRAPRPASPIVSIARTPSGSGLWLAGADGGVFALGDAAFAGSAAGISRRPVVELLAAPDGRGYLLVADDGGVFAFGSAVFPGSLGGMRLASPIVAGVATPSGLGVLLLGGDGGLFALGDASFSPRPELAAGHRATDLTISGDGTVRVVSAPISALPVSASRSGGDVAVPANSGSGRRIVYSLGAQRVWLVEADGSVARTYLVSGRAGTPSPGRYAVQSKSRHAWSSADSRVSMEYMVRFRGGIGFHTIPVRGGRPLQTEDQLGTPLSSGCVRQAFPDAIFLWEWTPVGTPVIVLA